MSLPYERICDYSSNLSSPAEVDGALFLVAQNGDILNFKEGQLKTEFHCGGQPSSIAIESTGKKFYLADMADQAIIMRELDDKNNESFSELVKEFEGQPLLGPNSLALSESMNCLFFTDSGPFGETSIENKKGSVFMIDLEDQIIRPLALNCLAYPSGLALSTDEKIVYVCETCKNRVLRFVYSQQGNYFFSFTGRFGPIACVVSPNDLLYVARFEFAHLSDEGMISVINNLGQIKENISLPGAPEITGLTFSSFKSYILYVTENSSQAQCIRVLVQNEQKDIEKKGKGDLKEIQGSFKQVKM